MSKEITEGLALTPARFVAGLVNWSSGDGLSGDPSYQGAGNAAVFPDDQDFGDCLELIKTTSTQKLRAFATTPIRQGLYLRVRARVKAVSGALPTVRVNAWVGIGPITQIPGLTTEGDAVTLTSYGEVVTVEAIIGTGSRGGVDLVWPTTARAARFGLDFTGPNGGVVRIEDIQIEDISSYWLYETVSRVNVLDYGAVGDGVTDNLSAFVEADLAAAPMASSSSRPETTSSAIT